MFVSSLWVAWALVLLLFLGHRPAHATGFESECSHVRHRQEGAPNPIASYRIVATFDPERHRVTGSTRVRWTNPSTTATSELYLHAYLNAFAHPRTTFLRSGNVSRTSSAGIESSGSLSISRLVAHEFGDLDLLPLLEKHSPNDPDDATDLRVALPFEVAIGSSLTLDIDFTATLPSLVARAGFSGTFHAVAQWFPKIARRDRTGIWRHFAYSSLAEFSSDFGDYDVTLDVPDAFVVAAPGLEVGKNAGVGRRQVHYCLSNAHDFAWFAWDEFVESQANAGPVRLRHYASRDQASNAAATLDTLRWGLEYFARQYFPYPFDSLTVVHPPDSARAASGMEYPQLITTGGPWFLPYLGSHATEAVALHELSHQWFYGIVASDEYLSPVLDEGLASWATSNALSARFGTASSFDSVWFSLSEAASRRVQSRRHSRRGPLARKANDFGDFSAIGGQIYARFPTLLETIAHVYGATTLQRALRGYAEKYRFAHPEPVDLVEAIRPHLPSGASNAISTALFSDGWIDLAVRAIDSSMLPKSGNYANRIRIERRGTFDLPVVLEVEFADGHVARRPLESVDRATWIEWPHSSPIVVATIDPDHLITIDDDLSNQTIRRNERPLLGRLAAVLHIALSTLYSCGWP